MTETILQLLGCMVIFAIAFALKGGQGKHMFDWWVKFRTTNKFTERLLDGKVISTLFVFFVMLFINLVCKDEILWMGILKSALFSAGWLSAIAPSIREEYLATKKKGLYMLGGFKKNHGIKKLWQRAVWGGACMALATDYTGYILAAGVFYVPIIYILMNKIDNGDKAWQISEPSIGAMVFGLPTFFFVKGLSLVAILLSLFV